LEGTHEGRNLSEIQQICSEALAEQMNLQQILKATIMKQIKLQRELQERVSSLCGDEI